MTSLTGGTKLGELSFVRHWKELGWENICDWGMNIICLSCKIRKFQVLLRSTFCLFWLFFQFEFEIGSNEVLMVRRPIFIAPIVRVCFPFEFYIQNSKYLLALKQQHTWQISCLLLLVFPEVLLAISIWFLAISKVEIGIRCRTGIACEPGGKNHKLFAGVLRSCELCRNRMPYQWWYNHDLFVIHAGQSETVKALYRVV